MTPARDDRGVSLIFVSGFADFVAQVSVLELLLQLSTIGYEFLFQGLSAFFSDFIQLHLGCGYLLSFQFPFFTSHSARHLHVSGVFLIVFDVTFHFFIVTLD